MKDYKVVSTVNKWVLYSDILKIIDENDNKVKNEIKNGWEPIGGASVCQIDDSEILVVSQAMILK